jgi:NAD+ synthase (glutamine-hydrolysing)
MKDGFVRVAVGTPRIRVADCPGNARSIASLMCRADERRAKLLVLPELCVTGYTANDLFLQRPLLDGALSALAEIRDASCDLDVLTCVGAPISLFGRLYNCAVFVKGGHILGVVPKRNPPNYSVYYELRHFFPGPRAVSDISLLGETVPFGGDLIFTCDQMPAFSVGCEICEDLWVPDSPSVRHALAGATVICNLSASDESIGKADYRRMLVRCQSAKLICAYLYAGAGEGESSTDLVFSGHDLVCENGIALAESKRYETELVFADVDVDVLDHERRRMNTFGDVPDGYRYVPFDVEMAALDLDRFVDPRPFVPANEREREARCEEILDIQAHGLATRLRHIGARKATIAVSGGLDSTLALLVAARAFDICEMPRSGILAITMPGFGTTTRTRSNAQVISERIGATFMEIPIGEAVEKHFRDIGQNPDVHDVTYENCQARERTQVLMDLANKTGGIAIGTGDLSELALGWATYNGDHMSMYAVNVSVPKTLVRYLVKYEADRASDESLAQSLNDILLTPVSPELLPPVGGEIAQRTEDLVGPYDLHDFFLYHILRRGATAEKTARLAKVAFGNEYSDETIRAWLKVFARRFFTQQFKRSCMPDGPKVGSVALSPWAICACLATPRAGSGSFQIRRDNMLFEKGDKVLFIGDSISDFNRARPVGEGLFEALGTSYVTDVAAQFTCMRPDLRIRFVNMGVSGNRVRDLKARWKTDVLNLKPDWVSVLIGINDVWRQFDSPLQTEEHVYPDEYEATYDEIIRETLPRVKGMILMTPYIMEPNQNDPMRARMDAYGGIVKKLAERHGQTLVDLQAAWDELFRHMHPMNIAWDRIHPNHVGHVYIANQFLKAVGF